MVDQSLPAPVDPVDIAHLIHQHHAELYRYAYRLCGSQTDAEDITQQTFLVVQQKIHQVREPEKVRSWLFTVLRSCFLKNCRKRTPTAATNLELDVDLIPDSAGDDGIDGDQLQQTLDELPEDYRVVLVMFYFEDCSYKEIADKLQLPIGTVMSRLSRAKSRLRHRLLGTETALR